MSADKQQAQRLADALDPFEQSKRIATLEAALRFYAAGDHFNHSDDDWDTVSGEPQNFWCDDAGTATVEDGTVARMALAGTPLEDERIDALESERQVQDAALVVARADFRELALRAEKLEAENAALKADAERYRWARAQLGSWESEAFLMGLTPEQYDAAIDAARSKT